MNTKPSIKGKPRAVRPDSPTIPIVRFLELAKISRGTWLTRAKAGLMPAAVKAGIPRAEALAYLQKQAEEAATAAARLRPSTGASTDIGTDG